MIRGAVLVAALLTVNAMAAPAQDAVAHLVEDREASAQLAKIIESTQAQGLPVEPILAKVQYATVMHASPQRIVAAARAIAARLPIARDALAPKDNIADVIAGEAALSFGVNKEAIKAIRQASVQPSIAVPLGVLAELVASHVPVSRASAIVLSLVKRGASGQQLAALEKSVIDDMGFGVSPDQALELRLQGLNAVLAPSAAGANAVGTNLAQPKRHP